MNPYALPTVLVNTEVLFIAFESAIINKEKIFKSGILGISLASAGSVVIAFNDGSQSANISYGDFLALSGVAFMAAYTMLGSRQRKKISSAVYTFLMYMSSAGTILLFLLISGTDIAGYRAVNFQMAAAMTLFCTFMGHSIFSYGLKYVPALFVSTAKIVRAYVCRSISGACIRANAAGLAYSWRHYDTYGDLYVFRKARNILTESKA